MASKEEAYEGREHSRIKHWLLEQYLTQLMLKVGSKWDRIAYIDGFAGPWETATEDLSDSSFGVAVEVMRKCRDKLRERNRHVSFRAFFLEKEAEPAARLKAFAERASGDGIALEADQGEFGQNVERLARWISSNEFAFVLVDPTGYKDSVAPSLLAPLLRLRNCELLINFMYEPIARFQGKADQAEHMKAIFGHDFEQQLKPRPSQAPEDRVRELYCQRLREASNTSGEHRLRAAAFPIEHADKDRTYYYLVYTTHNPTGLVTFVEVAESAHTEQATSKAQLKHRREREQSGITVDMFGPPVEVEPQRPSFHNPITQAILARLPAPGTEVLVDTKFVAGIIETCDGCLLGDLDGALQQMITAGTIENLDAKKVRRQHPVHWKKGERLRRKK